MRHYNESSPCSVVGLRGLLEVDFCLESWCFFEPSHVYMQGVNKCLLFTTNFDNVAVVREIRTCHFFFIFLFFNVALQDLGPIDQNCALFVVAFDFVFST